MENYTTLDQRLSLERPWSFDLGTDLSRSSLYAAICGIIVSLWFLKSYTKKSELDHIPKFKTWKIRWLWQSEKLLQQSYFEFKDQIYQINGPDGVQVLLPPQFMGEIKALPDEVLNNTIGIDEALQTKYTGFPAKTNGREGLINVIRARLSTDIVEKVPELRDELGLLEDAEFPECKDWTSFTWHPFSLRLISRLSGSIFIGPSISRTEQWTKTTINFAMLAFLAGAKLQLAPTWLRPIAQYLVPELRGVKKSIANTAAAIEPLLERRLAARGTPEEEVIEDGFVGPLVEAFEEDSKYDARIHADLQLMIAAASIHTTGSLLTECMFDLAARPELQDELRAEVEEVLETDGGWYEKDSMGDLMKLDSFIRESQRFGGNMATFFRKVMKPISFSDGTHLPAGTSVFYPLTGAGLDDRYYPDAETFDAMRYYRMRKESETAAEGNRHLLTTITDVNSHFGIARHTCPGRYLAAMEIKLVLAHFLLKYDMRLKEGEKRPSSIVVVMMKTAPAMSQIQFRRRADA